MDTAIWIGCLGLGCVGMEGLSYLLHRFLFHGLLWPIHKTHHQTHPSRLELNDLFSLVFGALAVVLLQVGSADRWHSPWYALGLGISLYGIVYFIAHDAYTHRRVLPFRSSHPGLRQIRRAHQRHHQCFDRQGQEPFGLFYIRYPATEAEPQESMDLDPSLKT